MLRSYLGRACAWLSRMAANDAVVTISVLTSVASIPAIVARDFPSGGPYGRHPITPTRPAAVHAVTAHGVASWQIALVITIALVAAAAVIVVLAQVRTDGQAKRRSKYAVAAGGGEYVRSLPWLFCRPRRPWKRSRGWPATRPRCDPELTG